MFPFLRGPTYVSPGPGVTLYIHRQIKHPKKLLSVHLFVSQGLLQMPRQRSARCWHSYGVQDVPRQQMYASERDGKHLRSYLFKHPRSYPFKANTLALICSNTLALILSNVCVFFCCASKARDGKAMPATAKTKQGRVGMARTRRTVGVPVQQTSPELNVCTPGPGVHVEQYVPGQEHLCLLICCDPWRWMDVF